MTWWLLLALSVKWQDYRVNFRIKSDIRSFWGIFAVI